MAFWQSQPPGKGALTDIESVRDRYEASFARFGTPSSVAVVPGSLGPISGEWHKAQDEFRAMLYFHGGGYVAGSPESHRGLVAKLVQASGVAAFVPRYRLAPENPFPAAVRDGLDAYRALIAHGVPSGSILLAGDEAGGGLAFAVALAARNANLERPAGVAALSPWADLALSGQAIFSNRAADIQLNWDQLFLAARSYLKKSNPCDIYASPAFAGLKDFAPVMVHAGAQEILRDDASKLGDRAAEAGVPVSVEIYDSMGHLFQADAKLNEAKVSLARLGQFIRSRTAVLAA
ncbi:MAG: alpha/beta hydrolase [Alphaproteobacteria bacterium]|nr:alpha/beta hydrolase [Alphaproteobacteria bacterium]